MSRDSIRFEARKILIQIQRANEWLVDDDESMALECSSVQYSAGHCLSVMSAVSSSSTQLQTLLSIYRFDSGVFSSGVFTTLAFIAALSTGVPSSASLNSGLFKHLLSAKTSQMPADDITHGPEPSLPHSN